MLYGLEAFRRYIQIYPAPYDDIDIGIIDSLLEGNISMDEDGLFHVTEFLNCSGEA